MKKKIDVNLIAVNWEKASRTLNYPAAAGYVPKIGVQTAKFIEFMVIFLQRKKNVRDVNFISFL